MNEIVIADKKKYVRQIVENLKNFLTVADKNKFFLSQTDLSDIDEIKEILQDLESERLEAHNIWEIESIKSEALRNKLARFPEEISNEIQNAIHAARALNEENIAELRNKLVKINTNIDKYSHQLDYFNKDNGELIPELEKLKIKHEEMVVLLNQHLSVKADKQIDLNEIRNQIHDDNEQIYQLEQNMLHLKEEMIRERAEAREKKRILTMETNQAQKKLDEQTKKNIELNKIYMDLKHEASVTTDCLNEKNTSLRNYAKSIGESKIKIKNCENTIDEVISDNEKLKGETIQLEDDIAESRVSFENWKSQIEDEISMFHESVKMSRQIHSELVSVKSHAASDLEKNNKTKDEASKYCRVLMNRLKEIEETSAAKAGDIGQMEFEITEMERRIIEEKENHDATMTLMNGQIQELKKQLEKERKQRIDVQDDNSILQDEINKFRNAHMVTMKEMNDKTNKCKSEHTRLQSQYTQLQKSIEENNSVSKKIETFLLDNKIKWKEEEENLIGEVNRLNREILDMEGQEKEKEKQLMDNEPNFEELKVYFEKRKKDYDKLKKNLVALKSRKTVLEDSIKRLEKSLEKETKDGETHMINKKNKTHQLSRQLDTEAIERSEIEKDIYVKTCYISTLKEEIKRLENKFKQQDEEKKRIDEIKMVTDKINSEFLDQIAGQKDALEEGRKNTDSLNKEFADNENEEINKLSKLYQQTQERRDLISDISEKLFSQIKSFDNFLGNLGTVGENNIL